MSTITHVIEQADGQLFVAFADGCCEALRRDDPEDAARVAAADAAVDAGALCIERGVRASNEHALVRAGGA